MADLPSPTPVDQDEPTDLEGLEGVTAAPQPSSSTTTVQLLHIGASQEENINRGVQPLQGCGAAASVHIPRQG